MNNQKNKPLPGAYLVLFLCSLTLIATIFLRSCPTILVPDLQGSFGVSPAEVALFSSATLLAYGLMQMPAGLITDAIGGRKTLTIFLLLAGVSTLAFAFSPSHKVGVGTRFVLGLTMAAVPPIASILARYFPPERYTQAMSVFMGAGNIGTLLASEPLARLSIAVGWRYAMAVSAVVVMLIGLAVFLCIKDGQPQKKVAPKVGMATTLKEIGHNMVKIFKLSQFWYLAVWYICAGGTFFSFMTMWAGPYLMDSYGMTKIEASRILLGQGVGALFLVPLIGTLADRLNSRRGMLIACAAIGLAGSCGLALGAGKLPPVLVAASIMSISACGAGGSTCVMSLIGRNLPKEMTGTGTGCVCMFWPIAASIFSVVIGVLLKNLSAGAGGMQALGQNGLAQVYGHTLLLYVALWALALVLSVFFIKENFSMKESKNTSQAPAPKSVALGLD